MISSSRSGRQVVIGPAPRGFARSFPMRSGAPPRACPSRAVPGGGRGAGGVQPVETKNCGRSRRREGHGRGHMSCSGGDGGRPADSERQRGTRPRGANCRGAAVREEGASTPPKQRAAECGGRRGGAGTTPRRPPEVPVRRPEPQMARGGVETSSSPFSPPSGERGRRRSPSMAAADGGAAARLERDGAAAYARSPHSPAGATDGLGRGRTL